MYCSVTSMGISGIDGYIIETEVNIMKGMPQFEIVGLPDAAVKESRDRVRAAIGNLGFTMPAGQIMVNLAPADTKKSGPIYDLPILLGILKAAGYIDGDFGDCAFIGEISLDGKLRSVGGVLPMAIAAEKAGVKKIFIPFENASEGRVIKNARVYPAKTVEEILDFLAGRGDITCAEDMEFSEAEETQHFDFADVMGQENAKRALEVAAAGGHNVLLIGPPGTGKSMLAKRLPSILPPLSYEEALETTKIHSVAGALASEEGLLRERPFRSPHHSISPAGLIGGGSNPKPGEISLANYGVLFLDEFPEFPKNVMEALRQPLEDGMITISRARGKASYPCNVMLVAAMNPCPCGYFGHPTIKCTCSKSKIAMYLNKISGPMLDRLDIHVEVPPVEYKRMSERAPAESSAEIRKRVIAARNIEYARLAPEGVWCNAKMTPAQTKKYCVLTPEADKFLSAIYDKLGFSGRTYDRLLKVSRTIADLDGAENIGVDHISEAVQYRNMDRKYWKKDVSEF